MVRQNVNLTTQSEREFLCDRIKELLQESELPTDVFCRYLMINPVDMHDWSNRCKKPMVAIPFLAYMVMKCVDEYGRIYPVPVYSIKELRTKTGLSQTKFCRRFRLKYKTLVNWESGRRNANVCVVHMINLLLNYEETYGAVIMEPEWSKMPEHYKM